MIRLLDSQGVEIFSSEDASTESNLVYYEITKKQILKKELTEIQVFLGFKLEEEIAEESPSIRAYQVAEPINREEVDTDKPYLTRIINSWRIKDIKLRGARGA